MIEPRRIVVVGYHAAELIDIACVTSALVMANWLRRSALYDPTVATPGGRPIVCGSGLTLQAESALERVTGPVDTVLVSGGIGHVQAAADPVLVAHVRRLARDARRVASVCTGAGILAASGVLDGRRAATHWFHADDLAASYPQVCFDPAPIYIRDGNLATSAGVTSALDLTLSFIEEDGGADLARSVARHMVTYLQRPGNQAQMSVFTSAPSAAGDVVRRVVDRITADPGGDLTTANLAAVAGVSERHLTRLFLQDLGETPGRFVRRARVEAAAHLLVTTALTVERIAVRCGFGSAESLRQAFTTRYGVAPSHYRRTQSATGGATTPGRGSGVDPLAVQLAR
ncbi:GlxA family transcriptional regulator [Luteipulveratus flavus]|uniref:GlxA family transcriptional regulator n=1 Tax=Luteipulveratus flavus TaxID=3031728 RepID=A0ABT6CA95_9MICO|nr:GlxA family transcriptional regulator [Luteipulveratus sp. YIM 133296]MDF8265815.1 GlxA family transcriptional regulator [Luteipulveratus sp. YIM 133296]